MTPEMMALVAIAVEMRGGAHWQTDVVGEAFMKKLGEHDSPSWFEVSCVLDSALGDSGLHRKPANISSIPLPSNADAQELALLTMVVNAVEQRGGQAWQVQNVLTSFKSFSSHLIGLPVSSINKVEFAEILNKALVTQGLGRKP